MHRRLGDLGRQGLVAYHHGPATGRWSYDTQGVSWWAVPPAPDWASAQLSWADFGLTICYVPGQTELTKHCLYERRLRFSMPLCSRLGSWARPRCRARLNQSSVRYMYARGGQAGAPIDTTAGPALEPPVAGHAVTRPADGDGADLPMGGCQLRALRDPSSVTRALSNLGKRRQIGARGPTLYVMAGQILAVVELTADNVGSIKSIERHGGVLEKVIDDGHGLVRLYWIEL